MTFNFWYIFLYVIWWLPAAILTRFIVAIAAAIADEFFK
jgi:hypothetical protein